MKVFAQAPTRLSLFGGGTDLPIYSDKYGGLIISMAINIRQRIEISDDCEQTIIPKNASENFYNKFFDDFGYKPSSLKAEFDAIIESGLGSSASAAVCLVAAITRKLGIPMNRREIAEKAWDVEVNKLGLYGGKQDQYAAAYGGINTFYFSKNGVYIKKLDDKYERMFKNHILMFYTGNNRESKKIQDGLKELTLDKLTALNRIKQIATYARDAVGRFDSTSIGKLLNEAWEAKKLSNNVSNDLIDSLYDLAIQEGAMGGKIMGSGGGGYMFFWVHPSDQQSVIKAMQLNGCELVDFSIDRNGVETRII
jgi:D-glycero-alpha-D-manno-heptose-7-phosphate kinase